MRRLKGAYMLTEEDAVVGRVFEDTIAWRSGPVDFGRQAGMRLARMKIHDVPYRALLSEQVDGLLVGGLCVSATPSGAASGKSMGNCMATGHAAGVAAALAAKKGVVPCDLKAREVQDRLRADGLTLEVQERKQEEPSPVRFLPARVPGNVAHHSRLIGVLAGSPFGIVGIVEEGPRRAHVEQRADEVRVGVREAPLRRVSWVTVDRK
jgi:hypothetical protein